MRVYRDQQKLKNGSAKGFTLMELLIAISLIAILTGVLLAVLNPRGIQAKARDSQRVSDLSKVKVALESYFSDNRSYPVQNSGWVYLDTGAVVSVALKPNYINNLPVDPKAVGTACTGTWRGYAYRSDGSKYILATNMETASMGGGCPFTGADAATWCTCTFSGGTAYYGTAD